MRGRPVDDGRQHAGVLGDPGDLHDVLAGRVGAEVGPLGGVRVTDQPGHLTRGLRGGVLQHHRGDVEQHLVEQRRQVGLGVDPQRGGTGSEVGQRLLVVGTPGHPGPDVPAAHAGRPTGGHEVVEQVRGPERRDGEAVERGARQPLPDEVVRVVVAEPSRLAEHRRGGCFPVGTGVVVGGVGEGEVTLLGLELGGLVQPALDGLV